MFFHDLSLSLEMLLLGEEENQKYHFSFFFRCLRLILEKKYIELLW